MPVGRNRVYVISIPYNISDEHDPSSLQRHRDIRQNYFNERVSWLRES